MKKALSQQRFWAILLLLTLVGALLRFWNLHAQIPIGDEWHTINRLLRGGWKEIYTNFGLADHCIPFTLYAKMLTETFGLTEWSMMMPSAVIGVLMIPLLGLWAQKALSPTTALIFAALLAASPLLVFFSRIGRPYIFITLLAGPVLWSARAAWKTGRPRWFIAYGLGMPLLGWNHLSALPLALAPLPILAIESMLLEKKLRLTSFLRVVYLGLVALIPSLLLIGIPLAYSPEALLSKTTPEQVTTASIFSALRILSGDAGNLLFLVTSALSLLGGIHLWRTYRSATQYLGIIAVLQIASVVLLNPVGITKPIVLARYLICLLPASLLCTACGIQALFAFLDKDRPPAPTLRTLASLLLVGIMFAKGPLPHIFRPYTNWTVQILWADMLKGTVPGIGERAEALQQLSNHLPGAYRHINSCKIPPKRILVAPWTFYMQSNPLPHYQQACKCRIYIGMLGNLTTPPTTFLIGETPANAPQFKWRNMLDLTDKDAITKAQIDGIVLHKNLMHEAKFYEHMPERRLQLYEQQSALVPAARSYLEQTYGPPEFEDDETAYFSLK